MKQPFLLLALVVLVVAIASIYLSQSRSKISYRSYLEIEVGMTNKQVEDILGGPPRCEGCGNLMCGITIVSFGSPPPIPAKWCGDGICIYVEYSNGIVCAKKYEQVDPGTSRPPWWHKWLGVTDRPLLRQ
jgi:hypothetical protein